MIKYKIKYTILGLILGMLSIGAMAQIEQYIVNRATYPIVINGQELDTIAFNMDGRTYLSLRDIAIATDTNVEWDSVGKQVVISGVGHNELKSNIAIPTPTPELITLPNGLLEQYNSNDYLEGYLKVNRDIVDKYNIIIERVGGSLNLYKSGEDFINKNEPLLSNIPSKTSYGRLFISQEYFEKYMLPIINNLK